MTLNKQVDDSDIIILIESSYGFVNNLLKTSIKKKYVELKKFSVSHGGIINILHTNKIKDIQHIDVESPVLLIKFKIDEKTIEQAIQEVIISKMSTQSKSSTCTSTINFYVK